jgi:hypothetical protein
MGAIAEAIAAYAEPLLDQTDGSLDQLNKAFALAQLCWNLALLSGEERDEAIGEMRLTLKMDDDEFEAFRRSVVVPMIRRHQEMFPRMHQRGSMQARERHGNRRRARQCRRALTGTGRPDAMHRVPVTVGESTSCVADDENLAPTSQRRRMTVMPNNNEQRSSIKRSPEG